MADDVLYSGVRGVTDLMVMPGLINLDFADIRAVMSEMGKAMMGTGEAEGEQRAIAAAEAAISNPLLDDVSLKGARAMLINITAGMDISLFEVDEAVNRVRSEVDPDANVIFGSTFDQSMEGRMRVSVVATGIDAGQMRDGGNARPQIITERRRPAPQFAQAADARMPATPAARPAEAAQAVSMQAPAALTAPATTRPAALDDAGMQETDSLPEQEAGQYFEEPQQAAIEEVQSQRTQGQRVEGAYIAPRPISAGPRPATPQPARPPLPPITQGGDVKKQGLFERMLGPRQAETAPPPLRQQTVQPRPAQPTQAPAPSQANLGIESPSRQAAKSEEEILDIPAFLRRQAN